MGPTPGILNLTFSAAESSQLPILPFGHHVTVRLTPGIDSHKVYEAYCIVSKATRRDKASEGRGMQTGLPHEMQYQLDVRDVVEVQV